MKPDKIIINDLNIKFRNLSSVEIYTLYPKVFENIFGYFDKFHTPQIVDIVVNKNKIIGFASGMLWNKDTWYSQFGGISRNFRNKGFGKKLYDFHLERIQTLFDIKYVTVRIENMNINAIKLILDIGFIAVGISESHGKTYIQFTRRL